MSIVLADARSLRPVSRRHAIHSSNTLTFDYNRAVGAAAIERSNDDTAEPADSESGRELASGGRGPREAPRPREPLSGKRHWVAERLRVASWAGRPCMRLPLPCRGLPAPGRLRVFVRTASGGPTQPNQGGAPPYVLETWRTAYGLLV
jgi:hypothetical protein